MNETLGQAGRYAPYVLAAYGISATVLAGLVLQTLVSAWRWRRRAGRDGDRR